MHIVVCALQEIVEKLQQELGESDGGASIVSRFPREIRRADIQLVDKLGSGQFGSVMKSFLDESSSKHGVPKYMVSPHALTLAHSGICPWHIVFGCG